MSTIRSSREIDLVFRAGHRAAHPLVIALVAPTPAGRDHDGRVAFIAGKKTGQRGHAEQGEAGPEGGRAAAGGPWPGFDVLLIARDRTATVVVRTRSRRALAARARRERVSRSERCPPAASRCLPRRLAMLLIRGYQRWISPALPPGVPIHADLFGVCANINRTLRRPQGWLAGC